MSRCTVPKKENPESQRSMTAKSLVALLRERAEQSPETNIFRWLADGERESSALTFGDLDRRARAIAFHLRSLKLKQSRAALLYGPGLEVIEALFGCFYAGIVAVPAYVPRTEREHPRVEGILRDADCGVVVTSS